MNLADFYRARVTPAPTATSGEVGPRGQSGRFSRPETGDVRRVPAGVHQSRRSRRKEVPR